MELSAIPQRAQPPIPWAEGEKIPWNESGFSERMLREHLSQEHDAASRRFGLIEKHVAWIHHVVLSGRPGRVLDLGCGPGLYTSRLARLGHICVGIDFSPASIGYARAEAQAQGLACHYHEADIRRADYGLGYDLAMLIFGEFNVFRPSDAHVILEKAYQALAPKGRLLMEVSRFETVQRIGEGSPSWYAAPQGLFSSRPHLCLRECFWDAPLKVATERYYIIDAATGQVEACAASSQAYQPAELQHTLERCGFQDVEFHPSLSGAVDSQSDYGVVVARR